MSPPGRRTAADRHSDAAAGVLCLTLPGDVLLYILLPLHAAAFGVSLPEVGVLLAANRLVRIVGYGWVARYFQRHGPRRSCFVATIGAALSTLGYALLSGVWALLVARLLWGLSFAALNISVQVLATAEAQGAARRSGRSRSIVAIGPMVGLLAGTALSLAIGPRPVFGLLALAAAAALAIVPKVPAMRGAPVALGPRVTLPTRLDVWSFMQGFGLDGLFVIGLTVLASAAIPDDAALAVGAALALRYLAEILLGPVGGHAAERWGAERLLVLLSLAAAAGLVAIGCGLLWSGAIAVVLLRALLQPLPAPVAALRHPGTQRVPAIARVATWRDLGAGVGPLAAGALLPVLPAWGVYGGTALVIALVSLALLARSPGR
ncbi:MAG: MFS transporter [Burkholderiales bacterium]|nr:MFS transporter [Burkholderiales bacterium]